MRHLSKLILACALAIGCASAPPGPPPKWMSDAQSAITAAEAAGANNVPAAADHLAKAKAALANATAGKGGDPVANAGVALAEAELAGSMTKDAKVQADLQTATNQLNALKAQ